MASSTATSTRDQSAATVITPVALLEHWQGHRRVTRRVIEAFPEDKLFSYSIGGMRPFSALATEFLNMAVPIARGVATGQWTGWGEGGRTAPTTKAELLRSWDEATDELNAVFPTIAPHQFQAVHKAFGQWEGTGIWQILYAIDNEVHHRGQGYVYLRSLGIDPPAFFDRS